RPHKASFQDLGLRDLCRRGAPRKVTPKIFATRFAQDFFRARSVMRAGVRANLLESTELSLEWQARRQLSLIIQWLRSADFYWRQHHDSTKLCFRWFPPATSAQAARSPTRVFRLPWYSRRNLTVSTAGKSAQERSEWDDRFMRRVWLRLSSSSRAGADRVFGYCDR